MAFFTHKDFGRLDWKLLQNGFIVLYWRFERLNEDASWLRQHGYQIDSIDCAMWEQEKDFHETIASALKFPDYCGMNLDALNDCLSDLEVPENGGRVLIMQKYDRVAAKMPQIAWPVLDILATNARRFLLFGRRFIVLVQSDDPHLHLDPVGAQQVLWNSRVWPNKKRRL